MELGPVAACVLVLASSGCAALRELPRPSRVPPPADAPRTVACFWVDRATPGPGEPPGPRASGRLWALDPNGRRVAVAGGLEDGFLRVDDLYAWTAERGREPLGVPPSAEAVQLACRDTVRAAFPDRATTVDRIAAARDGAEADVALSFDRASAGAPEGIAQRLVVFGDSLSDPGNLKRRLEVMPASPYYLGRFSNGPNWVQYLAEHTGLPVYDLAVGGAISVPHEDVPAESILAAIEQRGQYLLTGSLDEYVGDYLRDDLQDGQLQRTNDTLFAIWSGGNDYLSKEPLSGEINTLLDAPQEPSGYRHVVDETTRAIAEQVRRLYAAGGRRFLVLNLPDLGRIPGVLHNESYEARGVRDEGARLAQLSRRLSALTAYHNQQLRQRIDELHRELPGAVIVLGDAERAFTEILAERAPDGRFAYGFDLRSLRSTAARDRRGTIPIQDHCYAGGYLGTRDPSLVCGEQHDAFFWDNVHPTSFAHCWVAYFVARDLARAGLVARAPELDATRAYCSARQEAEAPEAYRAEVSAP